MRSRVLIGIAAWVVGAASATAGSLYAVDQLGQSLLAQHTKEISVAMVNSELALENSDRAHPGTAHAHTPTPSETPRRRHVRHAGVPPPSPLVSRPASHQASRLLSSSGGTAAAVCDGGLAHLLYWSPAQGFAVRHVVPGPGQTASVTFTDSSGGVVMRVTCNSAGVPGERVSTFSWGSHGDE